MKNTIAFLFAFISLVSFSEIRRSGLAASSICKSQSTIAEASAKDYIQDGLIALFDGEENAGWGVHENNIKRWQNLVDLSYISLRDGIVFGDNFATTDESFSSKYFGIMLLINGQNFNPAYVTSEAVFCTTSAERQFVILNLYRRSCLGVWNTDVGVGYWKGVSFGQSTIDKMISVSAVYPSSTGNVPERQYVNGISKISSNVNFSQPFSSGTVIGGSNYERAFSGKIFCIRLYDRQLTQEEVLHNYKIDKIRFLDILKHFYNQL